MEKLPPDRRQELTKTSTERLRMRLVKIGYDEEVVADTERGDLLNYYAEYLLSPPVPAEAAGGTGGDVSRSMSPDEIELRKLKEERKIRELEIREQERQDAKELRDRELTIREQELERQRLKDEAEMKRKESLAGQTKFYGEAMSLSLIHI